MEGDHPGGPFSISVMYKPLSGHPFPRLRDSPSEAGARLHQASDTRPLVGAGYVAGGCSPALAVLLRGGHRAPRDCGQLLILQTWRRALASPGRSPLPTRRDSAQQAWQNHLFRPVSPPRLPRRTLETAQTIHRCGLTGRQLFLHFLPEAAPAAPLKPGGQAQPLGGLLRHGPPSARDPASLPALPPVSHPHPLAALSDLRLHLGPRLPSLPG